MFQKIGALEDFIEELVELGSLAMVDFLGCIKADIAKATNSEAQNGRLTVQRV